MYWGWEETMKEVDCEADPFCRYYPRLPCGVMRIYYSDCLENIRQLLREDERRNNRLFDEAKRVLEEINIGQDYVMQRYHAQEARA